MQCRKCGTEYEGNFCPNCGEKAVQQQGKLLGFRTNVTWKKVLSIIYMVLIGLYVLGSFTTIDSANDAVNSVQGLLVLVAPYIFLSNFKLRNALPLFKQHKKGLSFLGMLCVYFAIALLCTMINPATHCDHQWNETEKIAATCTEDGQVKAHCDLCDSNKTEKLEKGHTFEVKEETEEKIVKVCSVCKEEEIEKKESKPTADDNQNSSNEETSQDAGDEYFQISDDANGKKADISTELIDTLVDKGYTLEHASEIAEILNAVGIESIKIENMTGTPESGLNAVICYPNGYTTRDRRFFFTTEDGVLFIAQFTDETLYDVDKGGYLKSYGDVHVPEKSIDMNTYTKLQGLAEIEVKKYLKHPSTASFGMLDWKIGRSDDNYKIMGCVSASNSFGVEDDLQFSVWFLKTSVGFSVEAVVIDGKQVK